jgi:hypothetical protein
MIDFTIEPADAQVQRRVIAKPRQRAQGAVS